MLRRSIAALAALVLLVGCSTDSSSQQADTSTSSPSETAAAVTPAEARAIAKDAYVYGFPLVDNYRVQYSYFVDKEDPEYKGGWNQIHNTARLYTPEDKAIQTPNSDTPYSFVGADLRTEPLVLTVPPIQQDRYYSLQFIDGYTYNFAYVGSRTTGNGGGTYLLAGPGWQGEKPEGVDEVIRSDTELAFVLYRTQLLGPSDLDGVKDVQAGYQVAPLSVFLNQPSPEPAPAIDFVPPLTPDQQRTSPQFFEILNFALRYAPVLPQEQALRDRFATIGIGPDGDYDADALTPEMRAAVEAGMADAWTEYDTFKKDKVETGEVTSAQFFGTREDLKDNYLYRMAGAVLGIYGNTAAEAIYPAAFNDAAGAPLTGANNYVYRFAPGQLPPVNAFWSLTMYELPGSVLVANPMNRYLISSTMLPSLVRDPDGGYTFTVQNASPGIEKESNWLPAPKGPFGLVLRLYWPKPDALNGTWTAPAPEKV
ncbi:MULTISPECIES: DUF1254 domain-containing protein [Mycolicibacterium]|uniref:Uncharacterized conserved protein n=2 Tax=Mycolicibacterium gilvum TaxID=1804 RepID=E6TH69_MYCSR|nr:MULTISPECIES: DUF1254 domain-containing protein [Mycolicibacterium]ABP45528.1 protein of unknown function DUF1254 [Mycolicibacterium gilvum PYR-GCK]ADT99009.1 uncharacterized conserved protein [Mycolicibacterium gilvum Spyr1]MBV5243359.1 DUF1254 domain-containing protein [Mycolicibacterium sp. PAM1]